MLRGWSKADVAKGAQTDLSRITGDKRGLDDAELKGTTCPPWTADPTLDRQRVLGR
jgi:hypothetical protein